MDLKMFCFLSQANEVNSPQEKSVHNYQHSKMLCHSHLEEDTSELGCHCDDPVKKYTTHLSQNTESSS